LVLVQSGLSGADRNDIYPDSAKIWKDPLANRPVQQWLARTGCRIKLLFIPAYCLYLNPIERLWGSMRGNTAHDKCYATFKDFSTARLNFLRGDAPGNWRTSAMRSRTISQSSIQRNSG
jgi:hypothetical protein